MAEFPIPSRDLAQARLVSLGEEPQVPQAGTQSSLAPAGRGDVSAPSTEQETSPVSDPSSAPGGSQQGQNFPFQMPRGHK